MEKRKYFFESELSEWDGDYKDENMISLRMDLNDTLMDLELIKRNIEEIQRNCPHDVNVLDRHENRYNIFVCVNCGKETRIDYLDGIIY